MQLQLTDPQFDHFTSEARYPLFVGGYGSGKSHALTACGLRDMVESPDGNVGIYCPTYDLLRLNLVPRFEELFTEVGMPYKLNKGAHIISVENHGDMIFRSMDNPSRIVAYEVFRSHCDEIDLLPKGKADEVWNRIIARNRQVVRSKAMNRVYAYSTPEGFEFTYRRWGKDPAAGYQYTRAETESNPFLPPDYIDALMDTYPPQLVDAYLKGLWVNLTSGAVYSKYDRELNGSDQVVVGNEPLDVGMDFNVHFGASTIHVHRDGQPHAVDEIRNAYDTDAQVAALRGKYPKNAITVWPDATGTHKKSSNTTASDIAKLKGAGFKVKHPHANPPIKDRVASVNGMICNGQGERRYFVNPSTCPELAAELEQQTYDANGQPDKSAGLDHGTDGVGYFLHGKYPIVRKHAHNITIIGNY